MSDWFTEYRLDPNYGYYTREHKRYEDATYYDEVLNRAVRKVLDEDKPLIWKSVGEDR